MICADLTSDYTDVSGYYSTHFPRISPPDVREAPAHFCVWLPVRFDGEMAYLDWQDEWRVEDLRQ
jgi:hypothetical protein